MKAVILAGGLGIRMGKICSSMPKPMINVCDKPLLLHQIEALKKEGIYDFIIITGYLSDKIEAFFSDGSPYGVNICYYKETTPLGTAGALFRLKLTEDFLLCNGDLIFDVDINSMVNFHKSNKALATLFSHPNSHPSDSLTLNTDEFNHITEIYPKGKKPENYQNLCNAGIQIVSPELLKRYNYTGKADFDSDIIIPAIETGKIFAYRSAEYVYDIGTPERLTHAENDILSGLVTKRNKSKLQKAIFVDRDGTLNIHKNYITEPSELELLPGVEEAINTFHQLGYLVIMITNQPIIARGECSFSGLKKIHNHLEMLLALKGAYIDGIYYCPHHPEQGFEGEIKELKIKCTCRKPSPELILQAQRDFNIDISKSYMVGDSHTDVAAGQNAGCMPVFLGDNNTICSLNFNSLKAFANFLKINNP